MLKIMLSFILFNYTTMMILCAPTPPFFTVISQITREETSEKITFTQRWIGKYVSGEISCLVISKNKLTNEILIEKSTKSSSSCNNLARRKKYNKIESRWYNQQMGEVYEKNIYNY